MPRVFAAHFVVVGCFFLITRIYAVTCPKGEFITKSGNCQPCPNGTYSDRINSTRCYQCEICRGRHNIPTKPCSSTTNSICNCKPGYYFQYSVLYCSKCRTCGIGRGVKKNCTRNSNTVCAPCEKGTYSDSKDLSRCKPCTKCKKGDTVKEECMKKRNTVCHNGKQNNLSKGTPVATPVPPPTPTTATPVTVLSTARSKPSKRARPAQSTKRNNSVLPFEVSLSVLSSFLFFVLVAFGCLMYRYRKRGSHNLAHQEVAAEASTGSTNVTPENHYTTVPVTGGRRGSKKMLREVPYTLINELAMYLNPREKWKILGGCLEFNNTEISNFGLVKQNATQVMLEEWGQRDCATVANLMKTFAAMKWHKEERICAEYV